MFESLLFRPNFPTQSKRSFDFFTFPNDLIVDNRNYYTEIQFFEYDSGTAGDVLNGLTETATTGAEIGAILGGLAGIFGNRGAGRITGGINGGLTGAGLGYVVGGAIGVEETVRNNIMTNGWRPQGIKGSPLGHMRLPIPQRINDTLTFSWGQESLSSAGLSMLSSLATQQAWVNQNYKTYNALNLARVGATGYGVAEGVAINPLFYQAFQNQNFREFQFQWILAPRTKTESATIASMITLLKRAASPGKAMQGFLLKYPAIAMFKFYPKDLNGGVILKPCIIQSVSIDHAPVGPSFFKGGDGAPVIIGLSLSVKELQLWYREDYMSDTTTTPSSSITVKNTTEIRDDRATPVSTNRDDRAPSVSAVRNFVSGNAPGER